MITSSIVTYYRKDSSEVRRKKQILYENIMFLANDDNITEIAVIDNSPKDDLKTLSKISPKIRYIYLNGENIGFSKAHNISRKLISEKRYHIIVNPDIIFTDKNIISELKLVMDSRNDVSLIQPLIKYQDHKTVQKLCKRNPTFLIQFFRAFLGKYINKFSFLRNYNNWFEMVDLAYKKDEVESEYLSGCFMFIRRTALEEVNWFDEDFFLYLEDADLTRKLSLTGKCLHYPKLSISHVWERGSHKSLKLKLIAIKSFFIYSFKWGFRLF